MFVLSLIRVLKQQFIKNINRKYQMLFFNDVINIKNLDPLLIKIDKKS